jgi:hypothetical protein
MRCIFTGAKNVVEQNRAEGARHLWRARTRFCVARAAEGGDAVTVLLGEVAYFISFLLSKYLFSFSFYIKI